MDVKFQMPSTSAHGRAATLTAALLAWTLNEHAEDGRATVEWEFTAPARVILQGSDYYARLNRAALLAFRSTRSEEHTSELQSLMRISSAVFSLKKIIPIT